MTGIEGRPVELAYDRESGLSDRLLWSRLSKATNVEDFAATWLAMQARVLGHVRLGVVILGDAADTGPFVPKAVFPPKRPVGADLAIAAETALAERKGVVRDQPAGERGEASQCIALPILVDEALFGVVAFELEPRSADALSHAGRQLQWGAAWIDVMVRRRSLLPGRQLVDLLDILAAVMEAPKLSVALQSFCAELARSVKAEWAACGLVQRGTRIGVEALSQSITTSRRQELVASTASAMQEAFDQRAIVQVPEDADAAPLVTRAHRRLTEAAASGGIVSVPIAENDAILGVLTLVARAGQTFSAADRDFCRLAATVVGPVIAVKRRDDRWIGMKVVVSLDETLRKLVGRKHPLLKLGTAAVLAAAAYLALGTASYRVTAQATVEGAVQRAVVVPVAGYIAGHGPRAGDRVSRGETMASLDDREFTIERSRWASEREQRLREYQKAFADGELSRVQVLKAEIEQSQAHIDLLDEQISRVDLKAPIDGIVVKGDLSQMLGAPVQRGDVLFEIAPLDDYRIILKVDERDMDEIREDQSGELILSSLSSMVMPLKITKVTPVSLAEEGKNVFRVEARLEGSNPAVRPGMQGYGKVMIGTRNVATIASARVLQWARMMIWRFRF